MRKHASAIKHIKAEPKSQTANASYEMEPNIAVDPKNFWSITAKILESLRVANPAKIDKGGKINVIS